MNRRVREALILVALAIAWLLLLVAADVLLVHLAGQPGGGTW